MDSLGGLGRLLRSRSRQVVLPPGEMADGEIEIASNTAGSKEQASQPVHEQGITPVTAIPTEQLQATQRTIAEHSAKLNTTMWKADTTASLLHRDQELQASKQLLLQGWPATMTERDRDAGLRSGTALLPRPETTANCHPHEYAPNKSRLARPLPRKRSFVVGSACFTWRRGSSCLFVGSPLCSYNKIGNHASSWRCLLGLN